MTRFQRTLIVEQSREYACQVREMLKEISASFLSTTSGEEAISLYDSYQPDLVLVEAILPGYDGFALMEHMFEDKHVLKIVLTSMNQDLINKKAAELEANYIFVKPYIKEIFVPRILEVAALREQNQKTQIASDENLFLEKMIMVALMVLGMPINIQGYTLLKDALLMVCKDGRSIRPLNKMIYRPLAEKYQTTEKCVERNIRHAIETSANRGQPKAFHEYFGYTISSEKGKPTNGEFIATLAEKLLLR